MRRCQRSNELFCRHFPDVAPDRVGDVGLSAVPTPRDGFQHDVVAQAHRGAPPFALSSERREVRLVCPVCRRIAWIRAPALTGTSGERGRVGGFGSWALGREVVAVDGAARRRALSPSTVRVDEPENPAT